MGIISLSVIFCLDIFDEDSSGEVDYKEFSQDVTRFSDTGDKDAKLLLSIFMIWIMIYL